VKFPTGGKITDFYDQAREHNEVQIRCKSGADGTVRMEEGFDLTNPGKDLPSMNAPKTCVFGIFL
jgi:hypothetical protein